MTRRFLTSTVVLFGLMASLLASSQTASAQGQGEVVDEIAAVVADDIILRSDVDAFLANYIQRSQSSFSEEMWMEALNELINQKVLAEHARRDTTIEITDDQVDQAIDQRIEQLSAQVGGQRRLEQMYGQSLVQIKADLQSDFKDRMLAEQFQSRRMQSIRVTPSEVRQFYEDIPQDSLPVLPDMVEASHIVRYPKPSEAEKAAAREIITTIRDSIVTGGASFEEMAQQFSEDPGSAPSGGRLEDVNLGDLFPEFAAVASRVEPGTVSQVFETPLGFHIMRLNERRGDVIDFRHILIRVDESRSDPSETIALLESVRDSIVAGQATFAAMAKRYSEEERSAQRGGRVMNPSTGDRTLAIDQLGPSWTRTLRDLEEGEISQPSEVELMNGDRAYHIVRLNDFIPEHRVNLETDYERIHQLALREKQARELGRWVDRLREDVYVDLRFDRSDLAAGRF